VTYSTRQRAWLQLMRTSFVIATRRGAPVTRPTRLIRSEAAETSTARGDADAARSQWHRQSYHTTIGAAVARWLGRDRGYQRSLDASSAYSRTCDRSIGKRIPRFCRALLQRTHCNGLATASRSKLRANADPPACALTSNSGHSGSHTGSTGGCRRWHGWWSPMRPSSRGVCG